MNGFRKGDRVRVSDPSSLAYDLAGTVSNPDTGAHIWPVEVLIDGHLYPSPFEPDELIGIDVRGRVA